MHFKQWQFKKVFISLILILTISGFAFDIKSVLAQALGTDRFGFDYAGQIEGLGTRDLRSSVIQIVNIFMGFLGIVAVGVLLYGGWVYMTSKGEAEQIEKAKKVLINGTIGLALILGSYAIVYFIINALLGATGGGGPGCDPTNQFDGVCCPTEASAGPGSDCYVAAGPGDDFVVTWVDPSDTETNVALCRLVQVGFNHVLDLDTVDDSAIWTGNVIVDSTNEDVNLQVIIQGGASAGAGCLANADCASGVCSGNFCQGNLVPGVITAWPLGSEKGLTFDNNNDFEINTTYQVTVRSSTLAPSGLDDSSGNRLTAGNKVWTFTTGSTTDTAPPTVSSVFPVDGEPDACMMTDISAIFSEPMDVASLYSSDPTPGNGMLPNSINSLYFDNTGSLVYESGNLIDGFNKSVPATTTLIAGAVEPYAQNSTYNPVLDSDVIRDSCGNYLDGDANGTAAGSPADDYGWTFDTQITLECTPEITGITPSPWWYYTAGSGEEITITGKNFNIAGEVIFNQNVYVNDTSNNCLAAMATAPTEAAPAITDCLLTGNWTPGQIIIGVPAGAGVSNGAITGDVVVIANSEMSNAWPFTVDSPHIDEIYPKFGNIDQYVTILGTNFGAVQGTSEVYFKEQANINNAIAAIYPCAAASWSDSQIIIKVPPGLPLDTDWYIQIDNETIDSGNRRWSNLVDFRTSNDPVTPGLCSVENQLAVDPSTLPGFVFPSEPTHFLNAGTPVSWRAWGEKGDEVQAVGENFELVQGTGYLNFGGVSAEVAIDWTTGTTINDNVPNVIPIRTDSVVLATVVQNSLESNPVLFGIYISPPPGPRIDYFEPTSGPVEEYITIYGNGFGDKKGGGDVLFNGISGDFSFPVACADNFWTDTQIVVKVPNTAALLPDAGLIKVITDAGLEDDTSDLAQPNFTTIAGVAGPGICNIEPKSGPVGFSDVNIYGERFTGVLPVAPLPNGVIFYNSKSAINYNFINDENISSVEVPNDSTPDDPTDDAVSGPITVTTANGISNGFDFQIFDCRSAAGACADIGYPTYECCYTGACEDPATGGCESPTEATYHWDFSSGTYSTCSGYSFNQCSAATSCPNSPGQCSPTQPQTIDTGTDCGDSYCDSTYGAACGAGCSFLNNTCISADTCDVFEDANSIIAGLVGTARCNNVSGNDVWQLEVPCQAGTYLDINGKCTLGSYGSPEYCDPSCAGGFICQSDESCIQSNICPGDSYCTADIDGDALDDCVKDQGGTCECCCRVGESVTDCCIGLTCEDLDCGTDDAVYDYGFCTGCAVWDTPPASSSDFFQTLSDEQCGCTSNTRVCIVDEENVSAPVDTVGEYGFCGDCETINATTITYDSDNDGDVDIDDIQDECTSHNVCCWDGTDCFTCSSLRVIEEACPPNDPSSPAPEKNKTNACVNSDISVKFNLDIDAATVSTANFEVLQCNTGGSFNSGACGGAPLSGAFTIIALPSQPEIIFNPAANLAVDTWYQVTINTNIESLNGLKMTSDYAWNFKTRNDSNPCDVESVNIAPEDEVITIPFDTRIYNALPVADCTYINSSDYNWGWSISDSTIATITNNDIMSPIGNTDPEQTATAQDKDGETLIRATEPVSLKFGETTLYVRLESPKVIDYWPDCGEACLNAAMGAKFNIPIDPATLTAANVELDQWLCGDGKIGIGEDCDDGNTKSGDGCSGISKTVAAVCNTFTTEEECINEDLDCFWDGAVCQDFSVAFNQTECQDANGYWDGANCVDNKGCLNEGSDGSNAVCGNNTIEEGEDCDGEVSAFPQGCDPITCLHTGSVAGLSVCGNSIVEDGEDCDDGNVISGDGCDINCLNEGQIDFINIPFGTITPTGIPFGTEVNMNLPVGVYFDSNSSYRIFFSNQIKSDGSGKQLIDLNYDFNHDNENDSFSWAFRTKDQFCSPDVVRIDPQDKTIYSIGTPQDYEAAPYGAPDACNSDGQKLNPYSYNWEWMSSDESVADIPVPNDNKWPECGNNRLEIGEDCDDGNNLSDDGCSDICLNEGTSRDMGLVAYWDFEEGNGTQVNDLSGNSNDGTLISGQWSDGKFGGALEFDGSSDYVKIPDDAATLHPAELTFTAWFQVNQIGDWGSILGHSGWPKLQVGPSGEISITDLPDSVGAAGSDLNSAVGLIAAGSWYHAAFTYDSLNRMKLYLDGVEVAQGLGIGPLNNWITADWFIGISDTPAASASDFFNGTIDDVRIYNTALTGAQIQGIMAQKDYLCGNGIIDFGEDCDGSPFPLGCDFDSCLHTGTAGVAICGNSIIESGEDCDDGNASGGDGCSVNCLNEGTLLDSYVDFYQTATTKSPGITNIEANVNYCSDEPVITCGGTLPICPSGTCEQTTGTSELEVICGFSNDDACSMGECNNLNQCINNTNIACLGIDLNGNGIDDACELTNTADATCDVDLTSHTCPISVWGGTCSVSNAICYSNSDCQSGESCQPYTDCNYCNNNTSFECRTANDLVPGPGNSDCDIGVGYDSCCYSRPVVESEFPDPDYFSPTVINCNNNATPTTKTDDYCDAFGPGNASCQTYTCNDTDGDTVADTCSAYGKCTDGIGGYEGYCLSDEDCPQDFYPTCDKSCSDDSECNDIVCGTCRNAQINITFNKLMDPASFISDGVCSNNASQSCSTHSNCGDGICLTNIRLGVKYDNAAVNQKNCPTGFYAESGLVYQPPNNFIAKAIEKIKFWINRLLGRQETVAAESWCAIPGTISSFNSNNRTTAIFTPQNLPNNLFESGITYQVTVKSGVKRVEGVNMTDDFIYQFTASDTECQVESVDIYISD
jgi:cysteine-rich repeat protein